MLKQIVFITMTNLRALPSRVGPTIVMIVGIGGVVGVLVSMVALTHGMDGTLEATASDSRVMVLSDGAQHVGQSSLGRAHQEAITQAPGIRRHSDGTPLLAIDPRVSVTLKGKLDEVERGVVVRGMPKEAFNMRPEIRLTEGQMFRAGMHEVVVGRSAERQFQNASIGDTIMLDNTSLAVVGVFESDGDWVESGFLMDPGAMMTVMGRDWVHAMILEVEDELGYGEFTEALDGHGALEFQVLKEPVYFERITQAFGEFVRPVVRVVSIIMAIGGLFCAANVMYSSVSARDVEIATYRAIGFSSFGVVTSIVVEACFIAFIGAIAGAFVSWLLFDGNVVTSGGTIASVVHEINVDLDVLAQGVVWAVSIGFLGALLPAVQAARLPISSVLRPI